MHVMLKCTKGEVTKFHVTLRRRPGQGDNAGCLPEDIVHRDRVDHQALRAEAPWFDLARECLPSVGHDLTRAMYFDSRRPCRSKTQQPSAAVSSALLELLTFDAL
jgi:hypothetical protein